MDKDEDVSHLNSGSSDKELSRKSTKGEIPEEDFDIFMNELSSPMQWKYYKRNQVESHLCEGHPGWSLQKVEFYKKMITYTISTTMDMES